MTDNPAERHDHEAWRARIAKLQELRVPFPEETIGKLPRSTCKRCSESSTKVCDQHSKRECASCGNYMTNAHIHLDYVGHAEVTDRLLTVDPEWSWEPMAWTDEGLPRIAKGVSGEWVLWIRLTVHGVTRPGVGSVSGGFDAEKQLIGDALRNASMRFGVALHLWSKSELESSIDETPAAAPPDPARIRRTRLADRAKALPPHAYEAFKAWLAASEYPAVPKDLTDEQCDTAEEWVSNAESEVEHATETPPEAPVDDSGASEAAGAPTTAHGPDFGSRGEQRTAAAAAYVKTLGQVDLLLAFSERGLKAPRPVGEQRVALAAALVADPDFVIPAPQHGTP